jgi:hypothetical protein
MLNFLKKKILMTGIFSGLPVFTAVLTGCYPGELDIGKGGSGSKRDNLYVQAYVGEEY